LSKSADYRRNSDDAPGRIAVLCSGGIDSAILLADALDRAQAVVPIYVRSGLFWEEAELEHLRRFLAAIRRASLQALCILEMPVGDLYGSHWSTTGNLVPRAGTSDDAVFLPGRNVLLLAKTILWCHLHQVWRLEIGLLASNPFPDAKEHFVSAFTGAVNEAVTGSVQVVQPFARLEKFKIIRAHRDLPLELTFSCICPREGRHCGRCNKCAERRQAFIAAQIPDQTDYAPETSCTA
jgi:7-cyano-7-deazaguanine synthase